MAKKKLPFNLPDFGGFTPPNFRVPESFIPKDNSELTKELMSRIKPVSEQFREALEPVYTELTRVTSELTKANERADVAEGRAIEAERESKKANRRSYWLSFIAFIIPFSYAVWSDWQKQSEKREAEKTQSTLQSLSREVQILKADISRAKTKHLPAKVPLRSIGVRPQKKP